MPTYNPKVIEPKWQRYWDEHKTFRTPDTSAKPKYYILDMFPYPSGAGLHVGHPEGYTATDILARYRRMRGFNVLHPMGWDAFGLPAEQYAVETGQHPRATTEKNIDTFRRQIKMLGFSYDWDREVDTTDPNYFKWTQWIFLQLYDTWYDEQQQKGRPISELPIPPAVQKLGEADVRAYRDSKRLAYMAEVPVNWCPALGTVLANEEVVDGKSERGGHPVVRMPLRQWMLRITAYAERLLADLDQVDWPEPIKEMQRNWIGRSEGAEVDFGLQIADCGLAASPSQAAIPNPQSAIRVFTTRPDTLFGATYMVLAPEHPLVDAITTSQCRDAVKKYQAEAARKSDLERTELAKKKTGVFTGAYAINPVNNEKIPIWIADYVLISYGTGAIMAVPAHDERDFEFAQQFKLPIRPVVMPPAGWLAESSTGKLIQNLDKTLDPSFEEGQIPKTASVEQTLSPKSASLIKQVAPLWAKHNGNAAQVVAELYVRHCQLFEEAFTGEGTAINSGQFTGLHTAEFKKQITAWLAERGLGCRKINYKLRDWLFSRQRYWGEPFPIVHGPDGPQALKDSDLPLELPELEDYKPSGKPEPPLGKAMEWVSLTINGKQYKRETNTMPQWAGSCWYYLRFIDPRNDKSFVDPAKEKYWMPIDLYVGGAEHAVLHLLYSRFWHKVLYDRSHVSTPEPFQRLVNQGMILGDVEFTGYRLNDKWVSAELVDFNDARTKKGGEQCERVRLNEEQIEKRADGFGLKDDPKIVVDGRAYKMSKARGNVVNPDQVVDQYGADSMRLYEMFMGPLEATKPWSMRGVEGVYRFLSRVWRLTIDDKADAMQLEPAIQDVPPDKETLRKLHQTIKKVTEDLDGMRFNTAIAAMMEFSNHLTKLPARPRAVFDPFVLLLSPFAPHLAEELWLTLGHKSTLAYEPWPQYEEALTKAEEIEVPVQVNGKVRSKVTVPAEVDETGLKAAVLADEKVKQQLAGKQIKKVIVVPKKLVNIVIG